MASKDDHDHNEIRILLTLFIALARNYIVVADTSSCVST